MTKFIRVLLIDDHPIIIDAYKNSLEQINALNSDLKFIVDSATCGDSALSKYELSLKNKPYDLIFVDINLPSNISKITSGEVLASIFKNLRHNVKIVIITGHYNALKFYNILQNINPDGLLYKSDIGIKAITKVVEDVINNVPYYSTSILQLLRKNISSKTTLNNIDKLLLYALNNGSKMKELKELLPLSQGGIEKRKRILKEVFKTQKQDDKALLKAAEENGFL
ncbi:DNA-binding response regulator [Algibacter marinivivus]|uniref:DNA-binding response regulator n=1 Tax=Algibacter marinivivus TaxID=2100723 RepID=A0A2U2X8B1_9FLAO|nr:response regulator [Algibacter marinivivus]PWH83980.1 DNA-binding response regulator [Algibacter marinivivus]